MANKIDIKTIHFKLDDMTKKYTEKKLTHLYKYIPKHARKSAKIRVNLEEMSKKRDDKFHAEVILALPDKTLTANGVGTSMTAAVDKLEPKILSQIRRYKTEINPRLGAKHGALRKIKLKFFKKQA